MKNNSIKNNNLQVLRNKIDKIDEKLLYLLNKRQKLIEQIGEYKRANGIKIISYHRENSIINKQLKQAKKYCLDGKMVQNIYRTIFIYSRKIQRAK